MPNFKLSPRLIESMCTVAKELTERRLAVAHAGFPVTPEQMQQALLPAKWQKTLNEMIADKVSLPRSAYTGVVFYGHGLTHTAKVQVYISSNFITLNHNACTFAWDVLNPDEADALAKWVNNLVTEKRLAELTKRTVSSLLNNHNYEVSIGHIAARWPALSLLVRERKSNWPKVDYQLWRQRFADPPRNLKPYQWTHHDRTVGWLATHQKAMRAAETILTSAVMLPDPATAEGMKVTLVDWVRNPGDKD